jgi:hypothetical protein
MNDKPSPQSCSTCGKPLSDKIFARLKDGDQWLLFCSTECLLSHFPRDKNAPYDDANFIETAQTFSQ